MTPVDLAKKVQTQSFIYGIITLGQFKVIMKKGWENRPYSIEEMMLYDEIFDED